MRIITSTLAAIVALFTTTSASAVELNFFYDNGCCAYTALVSWTQSNIPIVISSDSYAQSFTIAVSGTARQNNFGTYADPVIFTTLTYFAPTSPTNNSGFANEIIGGSGGTLYSGSTSNPVFSAGVYQMNSAVLTVTEVAPGVPEPATWGMMFIGMGAIGAALRRRQKISAVFADA